MYKNQLCAGWPVVALCSALLFTACTSSEKKTGATQTALTAVAKPRQVALEDFFKQPERSRYRISPDGKMLCYMAPWKNRQNIYVMPVGSTDSATRITSETERNYSSYDWASPDRIVFEKDFGGDENFHIFSVKSDGSQLKDLTPFKGVRAGIVNDLRDDDAHLLISMNKRNPEEFDVYKLNINDGKLTLVAQNPGSAENWMIDHEGNVRGCLQSDGVNQTMLFRDGASGPFRKLYTINFKDQVAFAGFTPDNKNIYVTSNRGRDKTAVFEFDTKTAKEGKLIYENPDVDVTSVSYSEEDKKLISVGYETDKMHEEFLDPAYAQTDKDIKAKTGADTYVTKSSDKAERKMIVQTYDDVSGGTIYLYDRDTKTATKLADRTPWIKREEMAAMKPIEYTSRDGMVIHGYLTLPVGVEPKNLPVIINPHGGPWARDGWGFNPEIQFLANRGYAVLQMNFRGSTGYGRKFWEASFKQWGLAMQDDITDGVEWLKKEGIADPNRIAIYGASYGGYATLAGVTFTPDLYACGVDYVGVSNMFTFMKTIPPYWKPFLGMMYEMAGDPVKDSALFAKVSPALHVDQIKCPLFVAQGKNDPRVNIEESNQIVDNLKKRGVSVEYMVKDNEGHGFSNQENQFDFYRAMETFLGKHMGPSATPAKKETACIPPARVQSKSDGCRA